MSVYVDNAAIPFGRMLMCHMVSDTRIELDAMADAIAVSRKWFHRGHYNICRSKRHEAIQRGAIQISMRDAARLRRKLERAPT